MPARQLWAFLTGGDVQRDAIEQQPRRLLIAEMHVLEIDRACDLRHIGRVRRIAKMLLK